MEIIRVCSIQRACVYRILDELSCRTLLGVYNTHRDFCLIAIQILHTSDNHVFVVFFFRILFFLSTRFLLDTAVAIGKKVVILYKAGRSFSFLFFFVFFCCCEWAGKKCSSRARYKSSRTESVRRLAERGSNWRPKQPDAVNGSTQQSNWKCVRSLALSRSLSLLALAHWKANAEQNINCRHRGWSMAHGMKAAGRSAALSFALSLTHSYLLTHAHVHSRRPAAGIVHSPLRAATTTSTIAAHGDGFVEVFFFISLFSVFCFIFRFLCVVQ